jgi:hypothetical protein
LFFLSQLFEFFLDVGGLCAYVFVIVMVMPMWVGWRKKTIAIVFHMQPVGPARVDISRMPPFFFDT